MSNLGATISIFKDLMFCCLNSATHYSLSTPLTTNFMCCQNTSEMSEARQVGWGTSEARALMAKCLEFASLATTSSLHSPSLNEIILIFFVKNYNLVVLQLMVLILL